MTPEELKKLEDTLEQYTVGRQTEVDDVLKALTERKGKTSSIVLTGQAGAGKTAIFKGIADKVAADAFAERFKKIVIMRPMSDETMKQLVDKLIDSNGGVPADRKEEAKAIVQEMLDQGFMDEEKGVRGLRPLIKAIADVSSEPDMREALASKYPVYTRRASVKSGERLADAFTNGTNGRTQARKPYRLKSNRPASGGVGFFTLH